MKLCMAPFMLLALTLPGHDLHGQSLGVTLARLQSDTDTIKENALYHLTHLGRTGGFPVCSPEARPQIKHALIAALQTENRLIEMGPGPFSESEMEFWANLIGCVAALRSVEAAPALLGAIDTGWGAIDGVVALGDAAVPGVVNTLRAGRSGSQRHAAAHAAGKLVADRDVLRLTQQSLAELRSGLLAALGDSDHFVRHSAIQALTPYSDTEIRERIEQLARTDPATSAHPRAPHYPVRRAAEAWLRQDSTKAGHKIRRQE